MVGCGAALRGPCPAAGGADLSPGAASAPWRRAACRSRRRRGWGRCPSLFPDGTGDDRASRAAVQTHGKPSAPSGTRPAAAQAAIGRQLVAYVDAPEDLPDAPGER